MLASSPSSSSRRTSPLAVAAVAIATFLILLAIVILVTGGFRFSIGTVRVSAHSPFTALVSAGALLLLGARVIGGDVRKALEAVEPFIERHASALALSIAAATLGAGVAFSTYSASGSDAAGYVSQATLMAEGRLTHDEPLASRVSWSDPTWSFSTLGYRPGARAGEIVPTYPPGLPAVMALAHRIGGDLGPYLVVPVLGAVAVALTFALGLLLHSARAGIAGAALLATSPIFLFQLVQPMSDVAATSWWTLSLLAAASRWRGGPFVAGLAAGAAICTRPNIAPLVLAVIVVLRLRRGAWLRPGVAFAAGVIPALVALLLIQQRLYGSMFASGYGSLDELFTTDAILPNLLAYAGRIVRGEWPTLLLVASGVAMRLFKRAAVASPRPWRHLVVATTTVVAILLACYLPYGVFTEWFYLRFLLPAFPLALILAGACLVAGTDRLSPATRGLVFAVILTLACSLNVVRAARQGAFSMHLYEARYRQVGRYLEAAYPPHVIFVASQESASLRYYTGRPVLRWDLLNTNLDEALNELERLGRIPVLVVEAFEREVLRARYPTARAARLDWRPRAHYTHSGPVEIYDFRDRTRSGSWHVDTPK